MCQIWLWVYVCTCPCLWDDFCVCLHTTLLTPLKIGNNGARMNGRVFEYEWTPYNTHYTVSFQIWKRQLIHINQ